MGKINIDTYKIKGIILNYIVPIVSIASVALVFLLVIRPSIKSIPDLSSKLEAESGREKKLQEKLQNLSKMYDFRNVVEENADLLSKVLPEKSAVPELLAQIDIIAKESGLQVTKLSSSFGEGKMADDKTSYSTVLVNLGVEGNYNQLQTFLKNIENAARMVDVSALRFSSQGIEKEGSYSATFVILSPYMFVESSAVTEDPIQIDITSNDFVSAINGFKKLKFYDIGPEQIIEVEETVQSTESAETE